MADKPIIFSAPMVRALLDGSKTQTRRVIKKKAAFDALTIGGPSWLTLAGNCDLLPINARPGDRLWVREAVTWVSAWGWRYRADNDDLTEKREAGEVGKWRPSIHMPRWASRLTLTVTDVRVERLQEIREADAVAEGVDAVPMDEVPRQASMSRRSDFAALWKSLHGPAAWGANPWVAAYTFTVQRGNIDQPEAPHA